MFKKVVVFILFLLIAFKVLPQDKPKVGLVLSGGGAKGLAHIGVIKVIEELGIEIDYIGGASMGSIVGGLYATGYSSDSLIQIANNLDWINFFNNRIDRHNLNMQNKQEQDRYLVSIKAHKFKPKLPKGLSSGQYFSEMYSKLVWPYLTVRNFNELPIPFLSVATNFENAQPVIFDSGYLPDVVRASMSIPTVFDPVYMDSMYLIDGGVSNNFPVNAVKDKGVDIIIGVSLGEDIDGIYEPGSLGSIVFQTTFSRSRVIKKENEENCDILIKPDFSNYGSMSFNNIDSLIAIGERAARQQLKGLRELAIQMSKFSPAENKNTKLPLHTYSINKVEISGLQLTNSDILNSYLRLKVPGELSRENLSTAIKRAYASRLYTSITYKLVPDADGFKLLIRVEEEPPQSFQFGAHYDSDFKAGILMNFNQKYHLGEKTLSFHADAIVSRYQYYELKNYFYSGVNKKGNYNWLPNFAVSFSYQNFTPFIFDDIGEIINDFHYIQSKPSGWIFYNIGNNFEINSGTEYQYSGIGPSLLNQNDVDSTTNTFKFFTQIFFDSYDDKWFPNKGLQFNTGFDYGITIDKDYYKFYRFNLGLEAVVSVFNRLTFSPGFKVASIYGSNITWDNRVFFGGINKTKTDFLTIPFVGYSFMEQPVNNAVAATASLRFRIFKQQYISAKYDVGKTASDIDLLESAEWLMGVGVTYSYNSMLGPIEVTLMQAKNKELQGYLNLGFWF